MISALRVVYFVILAPAVVLFFWSNLGIGAGLFYALVMYFLFPLLWSMEEQSRADIIARNARQA